MSRLDDDLRAALLESEAEAAARPVVVPESPIAPAPRGRPAVGLLVGLLAAAGAILFLVFASFDEAAIYSKTVDELVREGPALRGRTLRVQGVLVKGSLLRRDSPCEYRFKVQKNGAVVDVRYPHCTVPDTFRDVPETDVEVTATGKLADEGHFQASEILAKCPSKYEMKQRSAAGELAPHAPLPAPQGGGS